MRHLVAASCRFPPVACGLLVLLALAAVLAITIGRRRMVKPINLEGTKGGVA